VACCTGKIHGMTVIDRVADALARQPGGVPVGDLARQLGLSYQGIRNEIERSGSGHGVWLDRTSSPATARLAADRQTIARQPSARPDRRRKTQPTGFDESREPDWEGNVQARVCRWLLDEGWNLEQVANTATRERGTDVIARRDEQRVHVEVKGWPSLLYADPRRQAEVKRTNPTNQALHWFAGATLSCLRLREAHPADRVAMAFPDRPRYRKLGAEIAGALRSLHVELWFVDIEAVDTTPGGQPIGS
jgi:hypothetical protein